MVQRFVGKMQSGVGKYMQRIGQGKKRELGRCEFCHKGLGRGLGMGFLQGRVRGR